MPGVIRGYHKGLSGVIKRVIRVYLNNPTQDDVYVLIADETLSQILRVWPIHPPLCLETPSLIDSIALAERYE